MEFTRREHGEKKPALERKRWPFRPPVVALFLPIAGRIVVLLVVLLGGAGCGGGSSSKGSSVSSKAGGLVTPIHSVKISGAGEISVDFELEDAEGNPLSLAELDEKPQFVIGWIEVDAATRYTRYRSYIVETVEGRPYRFGGEDRDPALPVAEQAAVDVGGQFRALGEGRFRYVFGTVLPRGYDAGATHTVAAFLSREEGTFVENPVFHFVPGGGEPLLLRRTALTETCNRCHGPFEAHGGTRREIGLCVVCHTVDTTDPESGESLELGRMIHRIHRGVDFAEKPFLVVGGGLVRDYSNVVYPRDLRDCASCHDEDVNPAPEAELWRVQPARSTCGGCHDDVDFATGEGHSNGISQTSDLACKNCHRPDQVEEFDSTIAGAHQLPGGTSADPRLTLTITAVSGMVPGGQPAVRFTIRNASGVVEISSLDRAGITFAGPTSDYSQPLDDGHFTIQGSGAVPTLMTNAVGDYTFVPDTYRLPVDASGTWSVGLEARTAPLVAGDDAVRFGANNPVAHVDVSSGELGGGAPEPRRKVVDDAKCGVCHGDSRFHEGPPGPPPDETGDLRVETSYCVLCHHPRATDEATRPGVDPVTNPPSSIDFKVMIHRIHRGTDLENEYTVFGLDGAPRDFTRVRYPGNLARCDACHVDSTELLPPLAGTIPTVRGIGGVPVETDDAVLRPPAAACLGCHDGDATLEHALSFLQVPEDLCSVCHGPGGPVDAAVAHAEYR